MLKLFLIGIVIVELHENRNISSIGYAKIREFFSFIIQSLRAHPQLYISAAYYGGKRKL